MTRRPRAPRHTPAATRTPVSGMEAAGCALPQSGPALVTFAQRTGSNPSISAAFAS